MDDTNINIWELNTCKKRWLSAIRRRKKDDLQYFSFIYIPRRPPPLMVQSSFWRSHISTFNKIPIYNWLCFLPLCCTMRDGVLMNILVSCYSCSNCRTLVKGILCDCQLRAPSIGIFSYTCWFFYRNAFLIMKLNKLPLSFRMIRALIASQSMFENKLLTYSQFISYFLIVFWISFYTSSIVFWRVIFWE